MSDEVVPVVRVVVEAVVIFAGLVLGRLASDYDANDEGGIRARLQQRADELVVSAEAGAGQDATFLTITRAARPGLAPQGASVWHRPGSRIGISRQSQEVKNLLARSWTRAANRAGPRVKFVEPQRITARRDPTGHPQLRGIDFLSVVNVICIWKVDFSGVRAGLEGSQKRRRVPRWNQH